MIRYDFLVFFSADKTWIFGRGVPADPLSSVWSFESRIFLDSREKNWVRHKIYEVSAYMFDGTLYGNVWWQTKKTFK